MKTLEKFPVSTFPSIPRYVNKEENKESQVCWQVLLLALAALISVIHFEMIKIVYGLRRLLHCFVKSNVLCCYYE